MAKNSFVAEVTFNFEAVHVLGSGEGTTKFCKFWTVLLRGKEIIVSNSKVP